MRGAVMSEAAGQIAGPEEIVREGVEDIVEGVLAMRPVLEKMGDIRLAALPGRTDEELRHRHLVKGLVPDFVKPVGCSHARADARINEVEEDQPGKPARSFARERLHDRAAHIMADHAGAFNAEHFQQSQHVCRVIVGAERTGRFFAFPKAAKIRSDEREAIGEPQHDRLPGEPEFRPPMQQQERRAFARPRDVKRRAIRVSREMFDHPPPMCAGCLRVIMRAGRTATIRLGEVVRVSPALFRWE